MSDQDDLFPMIAHQVELVGVDQRAHDGYINATALCQAGERELGTRKEFTDYMRLKTTPRFLDVLSASTGIPVDQLIDIQRNVPNRNRGTWVHPQVAINLGQWVSPQFAVLVTEWVFDWMMGKGPFVETQVVLQRYAINQHKIPITHFSILNQMVLRFLTRMNTRGYILPEKLMPDISLGRMFSKWARERGHDPDSFPSYQHEWPAGDARPPVTARLYPNELLTDFNRELESWLIQGAALKYFKGKDDKSLIHLEEIIEEIKALAAPE